MQVIQEQFMMLFGSMLMHYTAPRLKIKLSVDLKKMPNIIDDAELKNINKNFLSCIFYYKIRIKMF